METLNLSDTHHRNHSAAPRIACSPLSVSTPCCHPYAGKEANLRASSHKSVSILQIGAFPHDEHFIKGGVEASIYGLSKTLLARHDVRTVQAVSVPDPHIASDTHKTVDGIPVWFPKAPGKGNISGLKRLPDILRHIRAINPDVIHLHGGTPVVFALLSYLRARSGIPIVYTLHGILAKETALQYDKRRTLQNRFQQYLYTFGERLALHSSKHTIIDTHYVARELLQLHPSARRDYITIPQGTFMNELAPFRRTDRQAAKTIVSVGVFSPRKSQHLLVEAFAKVYTALPDARLRLIGIAHNLPYLKQVKDTITRLGLDGVVSLETDQPRPAVLQALADARFFALHSEEESQGIALCEAMACGLPVVSTTAGGIPDVVPDGVAGLLSPYGDVDTFAQNLQRLFDNATLTRFSASALQRGQAFGWDSIAEQVYEVYRLAGMRSVHLPPELVHQRMPFGNTRAEEDAVLL